MKALTDICQKISQAQSTSSGGKRTYTSQGKTGSSLKSSKGSVTKTTEEKPFDAMNNIVANLLLNLTRYVCVGL